MLPDRREVANKLVDEATTAFKTIMITIIVFAIVTIVLVCAIIYLAVRLYV